MSSVHDILSKTNQQIGLLDDDKKMQYARDMGWFAGLRAAFFGQLGVREFRMIIEGKGLLSQKVKSREQH